MHDGSCLCGKVTIEVLGDFEHQPEMCHCTMCRKQASHAFAAVNIREEELGLEGEEHITWYQSSDDVRRGFCSNCGSVLFWQPTIEEYGHIAVAMGLFDGPTGLKLAKHTFVVEKGDYYDIDDEVPQSEAF